MNALKEQNQTESTDIYNETIVFLRMVQNEYNLLYYAYRTWN